MIARNSLIRQYQAKFSGEQAQSNRFKLVKMRFKYGISSSLELLDAERDSYSAQQALLQTQQTLLENRADIYKALGGGLKEYSQTAQSSVTNK